MLGFIRLQMKLRWGRESGGDKKSAVLSVAMGVLTIAVALALVYLFTGVLQEGVSGFGAQEISVLFIAVMQVVLAVTGVGMTVRWMFRPADLKITARFPLSPFQIFLANLLLVYINLQIYAAILYIPVMLAFGFALGTVTVKFVFGLLLSTVFAPMIPFALSTLISLPVMFLMSVLEHRNIVKLAVFIVVLAGFFVLYNYILTFLADYFIYKTVTDSVGIWEKILKALNSPFDLSVCLKGLLFFESAGKSAGILLGIFAAVSAAGIALAKPEYDAVRRNALESGGRAFPRRTRLNGDGVFAAMFKHEFKEILRTRVYAYFYLGIAVATPVMVFFCNRLVDEVGKAQMGDMISFGASMIVITAFVALINAFSAASLSREGPCFFITKIIPVSYRTQLMIKGLVNLIVSTGALLISCIVIVSLGFVTVGQVFVIFGCSLLLSVGFVANGLNLNLANPNVSLKSNGEFNEANIALMMIVGVFLSAAIGAASVILPFFIPMGFVYSVIGAFALVYAGANFAVFWLTARKKYAAAEV